MNNTKSKAIIIAIFFFITTAICSSQVATISITDINTKIMSNTKLLFGITFDGRSSLTGKSGYGQIGYHNANGTMIPEVSNIFNDLPYTTIRYPGNSNVVGFEWKKSIGAIGTRANQDILGALGVSQPVNFGFDEFMAMCESKGIFGKDIQIMVSIYDKSTVGLTSTQALAAVPNVVSENADWVEYCNSTNDGSNPGGGIDWAAQRAANGHPQPYGVKIWNIGNEPWASGEFGSSATNCNSFLSSVTPIINAMLAIDPSIKITMPTTGNGTSNTSWSYALLNSDLAKQGKIYSLSQHFFGDEDASTTNPGVSSSSSFIDNLVNAATAKGINVFIGDYAHSIPTPNPTMAQQNLAMQWQGANFEADFLLMLSQKSSIERSNFWAYGNSYAIWHPIRINSIGNYTLMPAAAIYKILNPTFLDKSVKVSTSSPAASDGIPYSIRSNAFVSNDLNNLNIVSVNRDKNNTVPLQVSGIISYKLSKARLLSASSLSSDTIIESKATTDLSGNFKMPPMCVLILEYKKTNIPTKPNLIEPQNKSVEIQTPTNTKWEKTDGAISYNFQIATDVKFANIVENKSDIKDTTYLTKELIQQTEYFWRVKAITSDTTSDWSDSWSFKTKKKNIPNKPTLIEPQNNSVEIQTPKLTKWGKVDGALSYNFQIADNIQFTNIIENKSDIKDTTYLTKELIQQTEYFWRVKAITSDTTSDWSETWSFKTKKNFIPIKLTLIEPQNKSVEIQTPTLTKWGKVDGALSYNFQIATDIQFTNINENKSDIKDTTYLTKELIQLTDYFWRVKAITIDTTSDWSETWSFKTKSKTSVQSEISKINFDLFPNPVTDYIQIKIEEMRLPMTLKIYDLIGNIVMEQTLSNTINSIDISKLNSGIYFLKSNDANGVFVKY